ncbi:MAG: DUF3127 domain-containing protein [Prevotella sp.]|nr:DUF3127 domain-containing protein [Prevotella sp.]
MALQGIEVEGIIIKEYPAKEGVSNRTGNAWKSQEFVIQTKDQYPRACLFRVFGADKLEQFNIHQGDSVHVWLDINARAWQDRYFNDISAFRVDHVDPNAMGAQSQPAAAPAQGMAQAPTAADPMAGTSDGTDDLPF